MNIRPVLASLVNAHPTFNAIRTMFEAETVNISTKQAEVLNRSLAAEGKPALSELVARNPFKASVKCSGTVDVAIRKLMCHFDCGSYGNWTYNDDVQMLPSGYLILEIIANRTTYAAFENASDFDVALIALEPPAWMVR